MPLQQKYGVLVVARTWPENLQQRCHKNWRSIFDTRYNGVIIALHCPMRQADVGEDSRLRKKSRSHGTCVTFVQFDKLTEQEIILCSAASGVVSSFGKTRVSLFWLAGALIPKKYQGNSGIAEISVQATGFILGETLLKGAHLALNALLRRELNDSMHRESEVSKVARRIRRAVQDVDTALRADKVYTSS